MSNIYLRNITNHFQDVRLISLASWPAAREISPRDRGGPYMVTQEGYDPADLKVVADEFVLGRSGKWLSLRHFFQMSTPERRAEFVFGTVAEVMAMMRDLPTKVEIIRPGAAPESSAPAPEQDEMAAAFQAGKAQPPGAAS
ncbi:MAG TPA: hypothetical protein VNT99_10140 [Methylomirabilota bacterium]|nr:hypothetical protein [Methylomirabilota bacterium]